MVTNDVATAGTERSARGSSGARSPIRYRIATIVLWALVFALWAATRQFSYISGLLFVLLGASALLLTTVASGGWGADMFRSTLFRESAARAVWTTGAVGTIVLFESVLFGPSEGLAVGASKLALSFVPSVYSCATAAALLAWTLRATSDVPLPRGGSLAGSASDLWLGRVLFAILVGWPLLHARWSVGGPRLVDSVWMLHWPAVLVLLGTLAAIRFIGGVRVRTNAASVALCSAGTVTALAGLLQALLGVAGAEIAIISAGISFFVTACFTTLLGLALVTFPRDDSRACWGGANGAQLATRIAWVLFPLVTVGLMAIAFVMILTPMTRKL